MRSLFSSSCSRFLLFNSTTCITICITACWCLLFLPAKTLAQQPFPAAPALSVLPDHLKQIQQKLTTLQKKIKELKQNSKQDQRLVADVDIYAKAAKWILKHNEFYRNTYGKMTIKALDIGLSRAALLQAGKTPWVHQGGTTIRGYYSAVDGSVQPYALQLPRGINTESGKRYPLTVKLHGRNSRLNEVWFIDRFDNQPLEDKTKNFVQVDVFGRGNNAFRWAGETDVFEAMKDLERVVKIDRRRITLWGFSMGGAGAWHLGLHHPTRWSSVGAGAGFVDFYQYQKQTEQLPSFQHQTLHIYDAIDYTRNATVVPFITYGGENDKQLIASTSMVTKAKAEGVDIKQLIGKGMGHKFHPESYKQFMDFHLLHSKKGRLLFPGKTDIQFITWTLKYNQCEWLTIEEMTHQYQPATVKSSVTDEGLLKLKTKNISTLQIDRNVAEMVEIDGNRLRLSSEADGLLPGVYYEKGNKGWKPLDYNESKEFMENPDTHKRHHLQGPIDDAFMQPFVCVKGTGSPWSQEINNWTNWTLKRFENEFDKWMRAKVPIVDDQHLSIQQMNEKNIILFGDPGSNSVIKRLLKELPIQWTKESIEVNGKKYDPKTHGICLIYPNPANPARYVVINSGHTMHEKDFKASNSWLFPKLGDIAVIKFKKEKENYRETTAWAALFNENWKLK